MDPVLSETARIHLRWSLIDGVGPITFSRLLHLFGDAEKALGAPTAQLEGVKGIGREKADRIARMRETVPIDKEIETAAQHGVRILCRADPDYPPGLKQIPDAPIILYVKGEFKETDAIALAVVGSRQCTFYGSEQARRFGELLAGAGFTVVSGLARGVDAFAQHGAIEAGGRSLAVLGNGLTDIYPPENRALADKILECGVWISELPMITAVRRENFPSRNRIIAGMTLGTLVVEAAQQSGALITARFANEYNREVFAVPGRIQEPMSLGTNALIRDGAAKLVTCLEDILDGLGEVGWTIKKRLEIPEETVSKTDKNAKGKKTSTKAGAQPPDLPNQSAAEPPPRNLQLSPVESRVYQLVPFEPVLQDFIVSNAEFPPGEILAAFTALELKGLIKRLPGQLVVRRGTA